MSVWNVEGNKIVFISDQRSHAYRPTTDRFVIRYVMPETVVDDENYIITVKISKWTVTNPSD